MDELLTAAFLAVCNASVWSFGSNPDRVEGAEKAPSGLWWGEKQWGAELYERSRSRSHRYTIKWSPSWLADLRVLRIACRHHWTVGSSHPRCGRCRRPVSQSPSPCGLPLIPLLPACAPVWHESHGSPRPWSRKGDDWLMPVACGEFHFSGRGIWGKRHWCSLRCCEFCEGGVGLDLFIWGISKCEDIKTICVKCPHMAVGYIL